MKQIIRENSQFLVLTLLWVVSGMYAGPAVYGVLPLVLLLFWRRQLYLELFMGFFLILVLSDSRSPLFGFAESAKNVYIVFLALFLLMERKKFDPLNKILSRFSVFIFIAILFIALSDNIAQTAQKTLSYVFILLVVPNYLLKGLRDDGPQALRRVIFWGTFLLMIGLVLRVLSPAMVTLAGRYTGILGNPNGLGLFCLLFFMVVTVTYDLRKELFSRKELIVIYTVIAFSVIYCGSRNAVFSILLFLFFRQFYKISPIIGFLIFLIFIVVYQFISNNLEVIILALGLEEFFRLETLRTGSGRTIAWEFGWEWINKSPLIGGGIGYTDRLYRANYEFLSIKGHQGNAHNSYITFWLDTGLLGVLAYVGGLVFSFVKGVSAIPSAIPALYAILFSAFFESWLTASLNPFTIQAIILMTLASTPELWEIMKSTDEEESEEDDNVEEELAFTSQRM